VVAERDRATLRKGYLIYGTGYDKRRIVGSSDRDSKGSSSTFGPTDAPLLARWAKLLIVVQIFISLSIVILLIARAAGVL
jgi:hypothetical protein